LKKKKKTIAVATFFDGFATRKWRRLPFFCGFAAMKVTVAMSSPSSMVMIFILLCLWFNSLGLTFNNKWWFFV